MGSQTIAVIVPAYNAALYLPRCLSSILEQRYSDLIVIVVDDGSTDKTSDVVIGFERDSRVRLLSQNNKGVSSARNCALTYIFTNYPDIGYIAFVDADDYLDSLYFHDMICTLSSTSDNADFVFSPLTFTNGLQDTNVKYRFDSDRISGIDYLKYLFNDTFPGGVIGKVFPSYLWEQNRFDESISLAEDYLALVRLITPNALIRYCSSSGYFYNQASTNSIMRGEMSNQKVISAIAAYFYSMLHCRNSSVLLPEASDAFAKTLLEFYPRFNTRKATKTDRKRLKAIVNSKATKTALLCYHPRLLKQRMKAFFFRHLRILYRPVYALGLFLCR